MHQVNRRENQSRFVAEEIAEFFKHITVGKPGGYQYHITDAHKSSGKRQPDNKQ
jgi:hypothetical protein